MSAVAVTSPLLRDVHVAWAWVVVVANGAVGVWALVAHREERARHRALWWATAAAQVAVLVQAVLGVALISGRETEPYEMHVFYGFVAAFSVGIIYSYRAQLAEHRHLLYGLGSLFVMGLGIRAMTLHP